MCTISMSLPIKIKELLAGVKGAQVLHYDRERRGHSAEPLDSGQGCGERTDSRGTVQLQGGFGHLRKRNSG
jgi:hypothetical protein